MELPITVTYIHNYTDNSTVSNEDIDDLWKHVLEDFEESQFTLNEPTTVLLIVLYVPIFLTSVIGNILVLIVIVPNKQLWNVTNNFLVNLAVADLLGKYLSHLTDIG